MIVDKSYSNSNNKTSFQNVWNIVSSDKLDKLPENKTSFSKLFSASENIILKDAKRTLNNNSDILESFDKLAHPNGICFKGIWSIDTKIIYSGYFKKNSKALIISRASTALSDTTNDTKRAFGFAGKLFASTNPTKINKFSSANFFLIDDLGGTDAKSYTEVSLTNEPSVSITFSVIKNLLYASKVAYNFAEADKNSGIRQLYEISQLGEKSLKNIITPKWMKIETQNNSKREAKDFRDELKITDKKLIFNIFVANKIVNNTKNWQKIGTIILDTSVVSNSCDHRLHFHHPKYRDDLNHKE
jgi:hypothetical protein